MNPISDTLIHFLGRTVKGNPEKQFEIFQSIIVNGIECNYIENTFGFTGLVWNKAACFTDIPLNFCDDQTAVYGKFGIGFKKSFIKSIGGNPVRYYIDHPVTFKPTDEGVETRGMLFFNLASLLKTVTDLQEIIQSPEFKGYFDEHGQIQVTKEKLQEFISLMIQVYSFEKPTGDLGPARDESQETDTYYKEREWRIIPFVASLFSGKIIQRDERYFVPFERNHVRIVIVPNDDIKNEANAWFLGLRNNEDVRLKRFGDDLLPILSYDELKYF